MRTTTTVGLLLALCGLLLMPPAGGRSGQQTGTRDELSTGDFRGTVAATERRRAADGPPALLRAVRAGGHANYDRVVFEFAGAEVPGYRVEYVNRPVQQCGSGATVALAGESRLLVRFTPAQAHNEAGAPTVRERAVLVRLPALKELKAICDFEGEVEWAIGLSSPNRYRVLELKDPARLIIDVKH